MIYLISLCVRIVDVYGENARWHALAPWILNKSGSDEAKEDKKILSSMSLLMKATIPGTHGMIKKASENFVLFWRQKKMYIPVRQNSE